MATETETVRLINEPTIEYANITGEESIFVDSLRAGVQQLIINTLLAWLAANLTAPVLTDANGHTYQITVDTNGDLGTEQLT